MIDSGWYKLSFNVGGSVVDRHSRLATLLHKLADTLKSDGRAVIVTEKPRPLSLTSGSISDVEVGKVNARVAVLCWLHMFCCVFG